MSLSTALGDILRQAGLSDVASISSEGDGSVYITVLEPVVTGRIASTLARRGLRVASMNETTLLATDVTAHEDAVKADLKKRVKTWRSYNQEHGADAGYRKANKFTDPRIFAMSMAKLAMIAAKRHGSLALRKLAAKLAAAANNKDGKVAAAILAEITSENAIRTVNPSVQKPGGTGLTLDPKITQPTFRGTLDEVGPVGPNQAMGESDEFGNDRSWSSEKAGRKASDQGLVGMAVKFLTQYQADNGLDGSSVAEIQDSSILEAWLVDLDSKGIKQDQVDAQEAWGEALQIVSPGTEDSDAIGYTGSEGLLGSKFHMVPMSAPGGDWANTIMSEEPGHVDLDKFTRKFAMGKESLKEAVDQCLDHFSGDMLPGEISEIDVRTFVRDEFPQVDWKDVYKVIQELAEPHKRHDEDDDKEKEKKSSRRKSSPVEVEDEKITSSKGMTKLPDGSGFFTGTVSHKKVCINCKGDGHATKVGTCPICSGSGRINSGKNASLLVLMDLRSVNPKHIMVIKGLGGVVSGRIARAAHTISLMGYLKNSGIPFKIQDYIHPLFGRREAKFGDPITPIAALDWRQLPWSVRAAVRALGLNKKVGNLTAQKFVEALRKGGATVASATGRSADELIQEFNDWLTNRPKSASRTARKRTVIASSEFQKDYIQKQFLKRRLRRVALLMDSCVESCDDAVIDGSTDKDAKARNPWAVCNGTLSEGDSDKKYERCVREVKKSSDVVPPLNRQLSTTSSVTSSGVPGGGSYLVIISYKGNPSSLTVTPPPGVSVLDYLKKKKIRGVQEIVPPGDWEYDPDTDVPRRKQEE